MTINFTINNFCCAVLEFCYSIFHPALVLMDVSIHAHVSTEILKRYKMWSILIFHYVTGNVALDAPVMIIGSENLPAIPLNSILEQTMIPSVGKVKQKIVSLLNY